MLAERAADMIRGRPLLPSSNVPVGLAEGWDKRQRPRAPVRSYVDQAA
jgi:choline dehydrogenase